MLVGYWDSAGFGGGAGRGGCAAVCLCAGVGCHDCFVEVVVEVFVLFLKKRKGVSCVVGTEVGSTSVMLVSNLVWNPNSEVL